MKKLLLLLTVAAAFGCGASRRPPQKSEFSAPPKQEQAVERPMSNRSKQCLRCHEGLNPGIVEDWRASRHARVTPEEALGKPENERRLSAKDVPAGMRSVVVGCYECHGLNANAHKDNFNHLGARINTVVTPNDCRVCHPTEADQFAGTKKAHAVANLRENPVYHGLVETTIGVKESKGGKLIPLKPSDHTEKATCFGCHGSVVTVKGTRAVDTDLGKLTFPRLTGWPNQGVGRVNPDGSLGACTACHPRHSFSIETARKPFTCSQCHREPDTPAWNVYQESKHGNLFMSRQNDGNWTNVPWAAGRDFRAPTCAVCHNSGIVDPNGKVLAERTHDFGSRLWVRLFGLPYSHPQPKTGKTCEIRNKNGQPLPTTFDGVPASEHLIDEKEQERRKGKMARVCRACHSATWVDQHFEDLSAAVKETDQMTLSATRLVQRAWKEGGADPSNPFDETIEQMWVKQWLFYSNSVRYSAAMGSYDLATFKNGWWQLTNNLQEMHERMLQRSEKK
jgi:hypothetical protein